MSSATSTSRVRDVQVNSAAEAVRQEARSDTSTFRAGHFFVLASLIAATGAVVISRQSTPEHLILISVTIASAGLAAAGFYRMLSPLVGDPAPQQSGQLSERARAVIEREKALALRALKELEFDRSMDKVSQADFDEMAGRLRARAMALMKQLDEDGSGYRAIIERELGSRLAARGVEKPSAPPAVPAPSAVPAPLAAAAPVAGLCSCGTANDPDARFCKRCGTKLTEA
jgi:zinc-ribbon domain